jgi:hypothetical protein
LTQALILGLNLWLRLIYPHSLPIFGDEGISIFWAQEFAQGHYQGYSLLMDGRYLFGVLLAAAGIYGPAPLGYARLIVAVLSSVGCASAMGLGRQLGTRATAALAGLIYAALPYSVFHERQSLADPLMASVGSLSVLLVVLSARRGGWRRAGVAGLAHSAAFLFKPSGILYGLAPALAVLTLAANRRQRWRRLAYAMGIVAVAGLVTGAFLWILAPRLGVNDGRIWQQSFGFLRCPPIVCRGDVAEQWRQLQVVLPALPGTLAVYFGWPALLLAGLAWPLSPPAGRRRPLFLVLFTTGLLVVLLLAGHQYLVARYYTPLAAPLAALAAHGVLTLTRRLVPRPQRLGWAVVVLLVVAAPLRNSLPLIARPELARLPAFDRQQYFTGDVAGGAIQAAARDIAARDRYPFILTRHFLRHSLAAYFDPTQAVILNPWDVRWQAALNHLAQGRPIFLLDEIGHGGEAVTGDARAYPYLEGRRLIRVQAIEPGDARAMARLYDFVYAGPREIDNDYVALAAALATALATGAEPSQPAVLATYPPHQLAVLNPLLPASLPLQPAFLGGSAPWETDAVIATMASLPGTGRLEVVFLNETLLDPQRQVELWLNTHAYRLSEQWFGPLRWVRYARGGAAEGQRLAPGARFGHEIDLAMVELLDPVSRAGGVARVRLTWWAVGPIKRPYKVFVHLFDAAGIVAQRDGQPVGELRPTFTWDVGETVVDQFGIEIPAEAAPGAYQLRVGLYDLETQARLPVLLADGATAEFWVGGTVTIE